MKNFKRIISRSVLLLVVIQLYSFGMLAQKNTSIPFQKLEGYVVKPGKLPSNSFYGQLFFRESLFSMNFIPKDIKTPPKNKIDFDSKTVVSLSGVKAKQEITLSLDKIVVSNQKLAIYFISKKGKKTKDFVVPYCLYTFPKQTNVFGLAYYLDGALLEDVKN